MARLSIDKVTKVFEEKTIVSTAVYLISSQFVGIGSNIEIFIDGTLYFSEQVSKNMEQYNI